MNNSLSIQTATTEKIPLIINLAEKVWFPTYNAILSKEQVYFMFTKIFSTDSLKEQIQDKNHIFKLVYRDHKPLAFASYSRISEVPVIYKLHKIYIDPDHQKEGLGKTLIKEIEECVRKEGGNLLFLNVNRSNPAIGFYEKMGYRIIREEDIPIGPYWMNDYVMQKEVSGKF